MAFPISRVKVWVALEVLTAADLNAEFNNIINNLAPENIDDFAANVTEFQTTTDPGEIGTESLPTDLSGELARLRFLIQEITGTTQWYESPPRSLSSLQDQVVQLSIGFTGKSVEDVLRDTCYAGVYNSQATLSATSNIRKGALDSSGFDSSNVKFGDFSIGAPTSGEHHFLIPGHYRRDNRFRVSLWFRNFPINSTIFRNSALGMTLEINSSAFLVFRLEERTAATETTKEAVTITGTTSVVLNTSFQHILAEVSINDDGNDFIRLYLDGAVEGTALTSQTMHVTDDTFGMYQLGGEVIPDPTTFNHFSAMSVLPKSESVDPWTGTEAGTVSDGVFTATGANDLENANNINLANFTLEMKARFRATDTISQLTAVNNSLRVRDDSMDRSFQIGFYNNGITLLEGTAGDQFITLLNTNEWHVYRVTSVGATDPTIKLFVDGVERLQITTNDDVDAAASDVIKLILAGSVSGLREVEIEYIRWADNVNSDADLPITSSDGINIAEVGLFDGPAIGAGLLSALQTKAINQLVTVHERGPTMIGASIGTNIDKTTTSTGLELITGASDFNSQLTLPIDGRSPFVVEALGIVSNTVTAAVGLGIGVSSDDTLTDVDNTGQDPTLSFSDGSFSTSFGLSTSTYNSNTATPTSATPTVDLNLGTVITGDAIHVYAQWIRIGSQDPTQARIFKTAGTSVVSFFDGRSEIIDDNAGTSIFEAAGTMNEYCMAGVLKVTTGGTLTLRFEITFGGSTNSTLEIASITHSTLSVDLYETVRRLFSSHKISENASNILVSRAALLLHSTSTGTLTTRGESMLKLNLMGKGLLI